MIVVDTASNQNMQPDTITCESTANRIPLSFVTPVKEASYVYC